MYTLDTIFWGLLRGEQMNKDVENYVKKNEEIEIITGLFTGAGSAFPDHGQGTEGFRISFPGIRRQLGITKDGRMAIRRRRRGIPLSGGCTAVLYRG